jgi:hypothetical protein
MSGPICPDCGMFDIDPFVDVGGTKKNRCTFCGWEGEPLPRKILYTKQMRSYRDEHRMMKKQRDEGMLFFIRIYVDDPEKAEDDPDLYDDLLDLLDIDTLDGPYHDPPYFFIKTEKKISERTIKKIMRSPRIVNISIF